MPIARCRAVHLTLSVLVAHALWAQQPNARTIVERSVAANDRDFKAAPGFNYKERDKQAGDGTKTYEVTMIEGSPYQRLIEINGKPLPPDQEAQEKKKQQQAAAQRHAESPSQKRDRIAKYETERRRDHEMMSQLGVAFDFALTGRGKIHGFNVWVLKATPRSGYRPPNTETLVLTGMNGELWIDQKTYHWVRVTAKVIHPVSIEGFLAQVQPGTEFELEKRPVEKGIWQITHFAMHSHARVLHLFNHSSEEDDTFFDFQKTEAANVQ